MGGGMGWKAPSGVELDALQDGQVVAINKGGVVRQAKFDAKSRTFRYEDEWYGKGKGDIINKIPGAIQDPSDPSYLRLNWSPFDQGFFKIGGNMVSTPESLDAVGVGESALKTAGKEAVRAAVPSTVGLGAFMLAQARTPGPPLAKLASGVISSAVASAGTGWLQDQTGLISQTDQDVINQTINPTSAKLGAFSPTLVAFRPSYGVLRAAAGFGGAVERDVALNTIKTGGLMNIGIAQGGAMVDPIIHGSPDPSINRFEASARTIGLGDPTKPWGGGPMDRMGHAATEFGIGGLLLHKPWGVGAGLHNLAHAGDPAQKVGFSGSPTEEALHHQRLNIQAKIDARNAELIKEAQKNKAFADASRDNPLTSTEQAGIDQIRQTLADARKKGMISQEAHDTAQNIATTLGREMLENVQLRQIGGKGERDTVEGEAKPGRLGDTKALTNAVILYAKAVERGRFESTLSHEIAHPLFDALTPEMRQELMSDLIRERQKIRKQDTAFDKILKFFGAEDSADWLEIADRTFQEHEARALFLHLKKTGLSDAESALAIDRLFQLNDDGSIRFKNELAGEDGKTSRRLWSVREFFSVEFARLIQNRGKYDKRWGVTDGKWYNFAKVFYNAMRRGLLRLVGESNATDDILDRITKKTLRDVMSDKSGVIPANATRPEVTKATDEEVGSKPIGEETTDKQLGDVLDSEEYKKFVRENTRAGVAIATGRIPISSREKEAAEDVSEKAKADLEAERAKLQTPQGRDFSGKVLSNEGRGIAERMLSEGDRDPSLPETSKEALKKLGIKNTVIGNVVRHSKIGSIRSEFDKASTAGEVAHIFRNTSQATQESIQVLVTDKDGNPLEIYRHTLSEPGSSTLLPSVMISQALSVKGAKKVWVSHNHPSMTPQFSGSDLGTEMNIKTMFKGTGLTLEGFLAIAGDKYAFIGKESKGRDLDRQDIPGSRFPATGREIPIIERRFTLPRGEDTDVVSTTKGDTDVNQRMLVQELLGGKPGVIFLDRNDRAVGHQEVTAEQMAKLGTAGARNLLAGFSRSGGTSIVVHVGGDTVADALQIQAGENVANLGASVRGNGKNFIKNIIGTNPLVRTLDSKGSRVAGFKSEGDATAFDRGEPETRVGVGAIKPLHAAPKSNFPIMADKLKDFGFESGYLNQFSEHAIVGQLKTGVTQVRTAGDVASLIHDYSSTLAQGQTMILIIGADGKPIQLGLHMVDSSMNVEDKVVIKPMWGVLAGQAVSTPGAKEAWMVRINNDVIPGEVDASVQNEIALKNLLEGSGINYRGLVAVAGRKYRSIEYTPGVQNKNGGHNQFDSTNVDWMPIDVRPATGTIPLTERRYSTRSQIPYDTGVTAPDRPIGAEDAGWNRSENASAKRLREHLGGDPGVVFKTSSGKIVGTVHLTLDEMANIRNSPAQKTLLAMMDRAGVNWGMVSVGDAPNDPAAARATSNINAFLKQMGLKVTDTFHNNLGVVPGDPVGTSEYRWQSEGDAEQAMPGDSFPDVPSKRATGIAFDQDGNRTDLNPDAKFPGIKIQDQGRSATGHLRLSPGTTKILGINSGVLELSEGSASRVWSNESRSYEVKGSGLKKIFMKHIPDFENLFGDLGADKESAVTGIIESALKNPDGYARVGEGTGRGYRDKNESRVSVFGYHGGEVIQIVFDTKSKPGVNQLITAFPITKETLGRYKGGSDYKYITAKHPDIRSGDMAERRAKLARLGTPLPEMLPDANGQMNKTPTARTASRGVTGENFVDAEGKSMAGKSFFSEGDAQEFNGRAEEAFKRDQIVGPEAIRGDFLAWAKSLKELANEHLFQAPYPQQYKDGADRERDQRRLQSHRVIDQLIAKLERQKGFNPMTLKPGFLDAVRKVSAQSTMISFKELAREAVNIHDATGLDPEAGGYIPPSDNLDGPNVERDKAHKSNLDHHWNKVKGYHEQFIKHIRLSMDTGVLNKQTGLEVIDMANEIRSRTFNRADGYGDMRGWGRMSEGDAENMRIPGGARDEAMKRRPARMNKTYLGIGHGGDHGVQYSADGPRPPFNPEKVFLYHYESETGKLTARNIAEMADSEGIEREDVKADSFVHGDQGELGIDTGVGIKRGGSGVNGRIEIDDDRGIIFVSAGSSRGELNNFRKGDAGQMRAEALSQVRKYVETMQKKGQLPKGYKIEGYGFDQNRSVWENQERFSEGDAQDNRSFREPNHKDETLTKNGFITNYADGKFIRGAQRDQTVLELRREYGTRSKVFDPSVLKDGTYRLDITDKVTGREYGHITFSMESETSAYVVSTLVRGVHENKGVAKVMYAELGERLRRAGVTELTGMVVDEYVDPKTGKVIHRPINAREAVFGLGSTEVNHRYERNMHDDDVWMHADVRTKINPARRLSEGDAEPAMPPDTNPRTGGNELANHTNVQLAKRGFISNYAHSKLRSLAGMKIRIGLQTDGTKPTTPVTEGMELDLGKEENTFQGKVEYTGENGLIEIAQFTYVIKNHGTLEDVGKKVVYVPSDDYSSALDWIKIKPQFRGRDLSNVIIAEIAERLKRLKTESISAFVVDPEGRPIKAFQRIFGDENVVVDDYGFEETDGRDPFRQADHRSDTGFVRRSRDVEATIDPKKLYSEGDDGENMRIPGGARDEFQRKTAGVKRQKPIKFWTDVGHADRRDAEGEQNTYLWYATKDGEIEVVSADELRGLTQIESDDIPTHHDWETHIEYGNIEGKYGKQPITSLPHGRIDDRGDVTRVSYMDHKNAGRTDYEFLRDEIKKKIAGFMLKQADEMPGYDFTNPTKPPERFSEGDADQNYEGLAFSENDVRKYIYGTPEERRGIFGSLPDKKNRDEFNIMSEYVRNKDFEDRPRIRELRAKQEARRKEIIEKHRAQGHPYPELAADQEMNPPPTGPDPEAELDQMRQSRRSDRGNMNSEGDAENMRIPGGARDEALKKREAMFRQKRFRAGDMNLLYTDIGHGDKFGTSGDVDTVNDPNRQFLWSYDKYGQFHVQSLREAIDEFNDLRMRTYKRRLAAGESETSIEYLKAPITESSFTHTEWAMGLGLSGPRDLDYKIGNGRLDITDDGKVRMSWVAKIKETNERQMMAQQIKEEAAAWLNSHKGNITLPYMKQKIPFAGTEADKVVGWNWGHGSEDATGRPRRFSEGDAENGRWENQERAKGKIPNAKVSNGETDLGFVLDPGEELDSKGLRIRKNTAGKMFWGSIGHDPEFFMMDKAVIDALGKNLPDNFDASVGLFAFDSSTGRVKTTQERLFSSHLEWLDPNQAVFGDSNYGRIPENYSLMGRFEPAIIGTDGVVIRRGRISLARNVAGGNWVFDTADFSRSDIPAGAMAKIREAIAEESNAILDGKNRAKFEPAQDTAGDHYDVFGFGMAKEKEAMGFSAKDTGPIKLNEDAKTYRDLADRPIGEGKDGQARLLKIGRQLSEGDAVEETPFRIPKTAGNRTNMQLAKDIATARFFTGISTKAHDNAAEFPLSKTMKEIANLIHARAGAEAGVTGLDLPTAIMKERTKQMNRFFEIMDPLRSEFAAMDRDGREQAYQELADMVTGLRSIDSSTSAGRAAEGIKAMLKEMHDYRTAAGEKLGEVEDYFPAVYDSINISENAMAFKEDAKRAYMIELRDAFQGDALEAAAEKAARELTMSHIRGEGEGTFNDLFESDAPAMGENSSMKRKFGPESQRIMSKWQIKDPYRIISRYIAGATKRAELTRRLGDEGQQWRRMAQALEKEGVSYEKIDEMRDLLKASVGVGLRQNTRGEQTFIDLMGLYTAGSVMGRSFLNNMFEPASMGIRSGNLSLGLQAYGQTWARTIRNAARVLSGERIDKTFWEQYAEHVGTISADVNDAWMNSHSIEVDGDRSDPRINWLTSKVYQSNLLQITENAKLQASHAIGFKYLVGLGEMHQGKSFMNKFDVTESVRSNLRELGIPDADHAQFAQWMTRLNSLDDAGRMRMLTSGGKMSKMFETAITKFSLQSSVRSNRAHKPVFQDGPIGKTLFQLMSYSYSYAADVNSRTYSYARSALKSAPAGKSYTVGDRIRFMAPLMMVPLSIIAYRALFALKDELYPTEFSEKHKDDPAWTKWLNATSYAGAFGPKVEMATKYVMRDQPPGGPLGQAVVGAARAAKTAVVNAVEGKPQDNAIRQAKKASVSPIKAATVIGATAVHPAAGTIASQVANSTAWSNAMTEADKKETDKKEKPKRY